MAYIGEIKLWAGTYAPVGWAFCAGQLLSIAENSFLYSQIGTTYGGDGISNFALPDLRGRVPVHHSPTYPTGQYGGTETHTPSPAPDLPRPTIRPTAFGPGTGAAQLRPTAPDRHRR
jgi:microcystin-dependent protein